MAQNGNSLAIVSTRQEVLCRAVPIYQNNSNLRRADFPQGFVFGTGTSAFQVEGAAAVDGKGPSMWDDITLRTPRMVADGSNGNVAVDMYHRYKEDIRMMKAMGFDAYRFSISWPRILPGGRTSAGINRKGIDYYNDLIDTVIAHGMQPYVTLFHWDVPDILEKEYHGFLSRKIVDDFLEFVAVCFWEFGDRVKWWTTINEPWTFAVYKYASDTRSQVSSQPDTVLKKKKLPPHRIAQCPDATIPKTAYSDVKFDKSDPAKDVYTVARNLLLAHAATVNLYRTKFQVFQKGQIGIVLNSHWYVPLDENSPDDVAAAKRAVDFMLGWFLGPVLYGRYPQSMIDFVLPENLAHFTHVESQMLKGSIDYLGINYYTTNYASHNPKPQGVGYYADKKVSFHTKRKDKLTGKKKRIGVRVSKWQTIVPWGLYEHLVYIKNTYPNVPPIYITENGVSEKSNYKLTAKEASADPVRVKFHQDHLANLLKAINQGEVDVRGYFAWSWCDNFEWLDGYTARFGIIYIDFLNNLTRYPKDSAIWFAQFLRGERTVGPLSKKRQIGDPESENVPEKRLKAL